MKTFIAVLSLLLLGTASASAAFYEYHGKMCITAITPICTTYGWAVGSCLTVRYVPPGIGENGTSTRMSVFGDTYAMSYAVATGTVVGSTFRPVVATKVARGGYQSSGASMRLPTQSPVSAANVFVYFTGEILRWDDLANCNVSFRASGILRTQ